MDHDVRGEVVERDGLRHDHADRDGHGRFLNPRDFGQLCPVFRKMLSYAFNVLGLDAGAGLGFGLTAGLGLTGYRAARLLRLGLGTSFAFSLVLRSLSLHGLVGFLIRGLALLGLVWASLIRGIVACTRRLQGILASLACLLAAFARLALLLRTAGRLSRTSGLLAFTDLAHMLATH